MSKHRLFVAATSVTRGSAPRPRWLLMLGVALLAALAAVGAGTRGHAQTAGPPPGRVYLGNMTDGGIVLITVNSAGTAATVLFSFGGATPSGCAASVAAVGVPFDSASSFARDGQSLPMQTNVAYTGFLDTLSFRYMVGSLSADPLPGSNCPSHRVAWRAVNSKVPVATARPRGSTTYDGVVLTAGSQPARGAAQVTVSADSSSITSWQLAYDGEPCDLTLWSVTSPRLNDGAWWGSQSGDTAASSATSVYAVAGATSFRGAFAAKAEGNCPAVAGTFVTHAPGAAVATGTPVSPASTVTPATPTAAVAGTAARLVNGVIPPNGGIGLIVFGGGTNAQLVAASGCSASTAAFWATTPAGAFVTYVPGASVAVVNEEWQARFAGAIPVNTALLGRCL
jgi:hypothetical protein